MTTRERYGDIIFFGLVGCIMVLAVVGTLLIAYYMPGWR